MYDPSDLSYILSSLLLFFVLAPDVKGPTKGVGRSVALDCH
jgi:hypothetical protein